MELFAICESKEDGPKEMKQSEWFADAVEEAVSLFRQLLIDKYKSMENMVL